MAQQREGLPTQLSQPRKDSEFQQLLHRLEVLNRWMELGIRPEPEDCRPEDLDLMEQEIDDCVELQQRCRRARDRLNQNLPVYNHSGTHESELVDRPSTISDAGHGLFYEPTPTIATEGIETKSRSIVKGACLCYYYGHLHDFHSAKLIEDRSYLMLVRDDVMVDAGPLPHIKAEARPHTRTKLNIKLLQRTNDVSMDW